VDGRPAAGVVLCTHSLSEVEGVCDDVVILSSGHVVAEGSVAEVIGIAQRNDGQRVIRIHVPSRSIEDAERVLRTVPSVIRVTRLGEATGWVGGGWSIQWRVDRPITTPPTRSWVP
jgi:ABC-type multidrug transport system ATPase subunit